MTKYLIGTGKQTALISFIIGSVIFGLYILSSNSNLLFVGYGFTIIAGIFNIIVLVLTLSKAYNHSKSRTKLIKSSVIMLLNIPVLFVYVWLAMLILGNMRITFTNDTQHKLTDININGCETEHISSLEPNESTTVWVGITGDCSIHVDFMQNGDKKNEIVAGYVTRGMGQKMKHKIGGDHRIEF